MKEISITIDDLPVCTGVAGVMSKQCMIDRLLAHFMNYDVLPVGFVIESCLYENNILAVDQVEQLKKWLDAGGELGNHGFSHKSYSEVSIEEYLEDIRKGEMITNELLSDRSGKVRYFRNPFLDMGDSSEKREAMTFFLNQHEYTLAPITIDGWDWKFNLAYEDALKGDDRVGAGEIGNKYVEYTKGNLLFREFQSMQLFGYSIPQVLLLHANAINADYLGDLLQMMKEQGYAFVTLEKALSDKGYCSPDTFYNKKGVSWLDRWIFSLGMEIDCGNVVPPIPDCVKTIKGKAEV